jgi:hypothetical protein
MILQRWRSLDPSPVAVLVRSFDFIYYQSRFYIGEAGCSAMQKEWAR